MTSSGNAKNLSDIAKSCQTLKSTVPKKFNRAPSGGNNHRKVNPNMAARISFLYRAAKYLATVDNEIVGNSLEGLTRHLTQQSKATALKTQIRINKSVKRAICKRCGIIQTNQTSCAIIHKSEGTVQIHCQRCNAIKRFPLHNIREQ